MELRKLWDNPGQEPKYNNVCDVYGAEHLARLIGKLLFAILKSFVYSATN